MSSDVLRAEDPLLSDPPPKFDPRLGKLLYPEDSRRGSKPAPDPKWNVFPRYFCVTDMFTSSAEAALPLSLHGGVRGVAV